MQNVETIYKNLGLQDLSQGSLK